MFCMCTCQKLHNLIEVVVISCPYVYCIIILDFIFNLCHNFWTLHPSPLSTCHACLNSNPHPFFAWHTLWTVLKFTKAPWLGFPLTIGEKGLFATKHFNYSSPPLDVWWRRAIWDMGRQLIVGECSPCKPQSLPLAVIPVTRNDPVDVENRLMDKPAERTLSQIDRKAKPKCYLSHR